MMRKSLGKMIAILYRKDRNYYIKQLDRYSLGTSQLAFLLEISNFGEISQDELSNKIAMDKTSVSKIAKKLINLEYIYMVRDKDDKRVKRISLTKKGQEIIPILEETAKNWTYIISKGLSEEEKEMIYGILDKMIRNVSEYEVEQD